MSMIDLSNDATSTFVANHIKLVGSLRWHDVVLRITGVLAHSPVTITERAWEAMTRLGMDADFGEDPLFEASIIVPFWCVVLYLIPKDLDWKRRAYKRGSRDREWAEAFMAVYDVGGETAARKFCRDA